MVKRIIRVQLYRPDCGRIVEITRNGVAIARAYGGRRSTFNEVIRAARRKYRQATKL